MKRLINFLFFIDEMGKLQKLVPMTKLTESIASESLITALFNEIFTPYFQLKKQLLEKEGGCCPKEVDLMLDGYILTMKFHPLNPLNEQKYRLAISFSDGRKPEPTNSQKNDLINGDVQKDLNELSHEIKNSVNIIQGISDLMKDPSRSSTLDLMPHLDSSIKYLKSLVMNYLMDQKSQKQRWEKSLFYLRDELDELIEQFMFLNKTGEQQFEFSYDSRIPRTLKGYPVALRQVLINLLFNAFEHSQGGQIRLQVQRVFETDKTIRIFFSVEDSGKGFPVDSWNLEIKAPQESISSNKGFGLGLKICQNILNAMDSEIKIQSELNKGSQFSFELEFSKSNTEFNSFQLENREENGEVFFLGKKALVVDDNALNRLVAQKYLNQLGFCTQESLDGISALQKLHEEEFDLLILDIHLPILDGIGLLSLILPRFTKLKVILASGDSNYRQNISSYPKKKVAFLEKPYSKKDLERILREDFRD